MFRTLERVLLRCVSGEEVVLWPGSCFPLGSSWDPGPRRIVGLWGARGLGGQLSGSHHALQAPTQSHVCTESIAPDFITNLFYRLANVLSFPEDDLVDSQRSRKSHNDRRASVLLFHWVLGCDPFPSAWLILEMLPFEIFLHSLLTIRSNTLWLESYLTRLWINLSHYFLTAVQTSTWDKRSQGKGPWWDVQEGQWDWEWGFKALCILCISVCVYR